MNLQTFFTYIVLLIILALAFHLIMKIFNDNNKKMTNIDNFCSSQCELSDINNNKLIALSGKSKSKSKSKRNNSNNNYDNNNYNTYIKEFIYGDKIPDDTPETKFSKNDMQNYRDDFCNFRNKTNYLSNNIDTTEIINESVLRNNGEFGAIDKDITVGTKISDIYDAYTDNHYKTNSNNIAPSYDNLKQYKMNGNDGSIYTNDNWMYDTDNVMNGGEFLDNIVGTNNNNSENMTL